MAGVPPRRITPVLLLCLGLLGLGLAGCASLVDPDHLRLCRALLPALHAEGVAIRETRHLAIENRPNALRIDYLAEEPGRPRGTHYAVCTFAGGGADASRLDLAALDTDRGPVTDLRLEILRRWWLGDAAVLAEAARRISTGRPAPGVPFALAYALQQAANGLVPATLYGLLAAAYALVYGLVGRINLAFGEIAVAGAYATLGLAAGLAATLGPLPALMAGLAAGMIAAAALSQVVAGVVAAPAARGTRAGQSALIATVGLAVALAEALRMIHGSAPRWSPPLASTLIPLARSGDFVATVTINQIGTAIVLAAAAAALLLVMRHTGFGRRWRAFADDPGAARLFGVDPGRMITITFALSGALAGLAGAAHAVHFGSTHFALGTVFALKALIGALAGGIGSVGGALAGGLALGFVETLWSGYGPIGWRDTIVFTVLVVLVVMRPAGLFAREGRNA
jgi:branched-chain amino acid transport system permease protein